MIKQLCELAKKEDLVKHPALTKITPTIIIDLDSEGNCLGVRSIDKKEARGFLCESVTKTRNVVARVLVDNSEYLLGITADETKNAKNVTPQDKFNAFLDKNTPYLRETAHLKPVYNFYFDKKTTGLEKAKALFSELDKKAKVGVIAFYLPTGKYAHGLPEVLEKIKSDYDTAQLEKIASGTKECSVCARNQFPIEPIHEKIKRIPSGQASGNALVSYNSDAFCSYGLEQNENSKICSDCAKNYVSALNWLLSEGRPVPNEKGKEKFVFTHRKNLGSDTAILFWTRDKSGFDPMDFLDAPQDDEVARLLSSPDSGREADIRLEENQFYSITLSGSAARIALRDWIEISLYQTKSNLCNWFTDIEIIDNKKKAYTPLWKMAHACKGSTDKDPLSSRVQGILWRCAIKNQLVPLWVLSAVINRIRADSSKFKWRKKESNDLSIYEIFSSARIALMKLTINRLNKEERPIMLDLDRENNNTAYLCGRLLSVLADIQHASLGDVNAGVVDRFYSSASTTPSVAFGRLIKNAQYHLSKMRSEKPGLTVKLEKKLTELIGKINDFPQTLTLEDQGRFAIGFYHQQQLRFESNQ